MFLTAVYPTSTAAIKAAAPLLHGGGISRAIRRICVISAALRHLPAALKCQLGGYSRTSRRAIQRKYCKFCTICSMICIF